MVQESTENKLTEKITLSADEKEEEAKAERESKMLATMIDDDHLPNQDKPVERNISMNSAIIGVVVDKFKSCDGGLSFFLRVWRVAMEGFGAGIARSTFSSPSNISISIEIRSQALTVHRARSVFSPHSVVRPGVSVTVMD